MYLTQAQIQLACVNKMTTKALSNLRSWNTAITKYGHLVGLDNIHCEVAYTAQIMHESGEFVYDREIWGNTPAQQRYDTRTDLGNTPQRDGDGKKYMGRTAIQATGKEMYRLFYKWCVKMMPDTKVPDFVANPDLLNTDPWEGLFPIFFFELKKLKQYGESGNYEMMTRRINGGLTHYDYRCTKYTRLGLVRLGYLPTAVSTFQKDYKLKVDQVAGPATRDAIHSALKALNILEKTGNLRVNLSPKVQAELVAFNPKPTTTRLKPK